MLDLLIGQVIINGQLDLVLEILLLGHWALAVAVTEGAELSQQVHGEVADGDIDPFFLLHVADEIIFAGADHLWIVEEGVKVVDVAGVGLLFLQRDAGDARKSCIQPSGDLPALVVELLQLSQLHQAHRSLQLAHAVILTDFKLIVIIVLVKGLLGVPIMVIIRLGIRSDALVSPIVHAPVHVNGAQGFREFVQLIAVGDEHAALAGGHFLEGMEAEAAHIAQVVTQKVCGVQITSSPSLSPRICPERNRAEVQGFIARACLMPIFLQKACLLRAAAQEPAATGAPENPGVGGAR